MMKSIFTTILAAALLLSMLGGCAKDMSGETRNTPPAAATAAATATPRPTTGTSARPKATDSTADGIIDAGKDAVDGVVGAGEDAVNDIVDAGEDAVDEVTGRDRTKTSGSSRPTATPKAAAKD